MLQPLQGRMQLLWPSEKINMQPNRILKCDERLTTSILIYCTGICTTPGHNWYDVCHCVDVSNCFLVSDHLVPALFVLKFRFISLRRTQTTWTYVYPMFPGVPSWHSANGLNTLENTSKFQGKYIVGVGIRSRTKQEYNTWYLSVQILQKEQLPK